MRSTDEYMNEIMKKSEIIKEQHTSKIVAAIEAACSLGCLALMVLVAELAPGLTANGNVAAEVHYGSLILKASYMGYVVMGALAFLLGILVTLLCVQVKHHRELSKKYGEQHD